MPASTPALLSLRVGDPALTLRRLLVIDDDLASCRLVAAVFRHEPFELVLASDGPSGLARFEKLAPDIVLLELGLPGMPGLEVLDRLRALAPAVPVVVLSARTEVQVVVSATRRGAADFLTKPVIAEELLRGVRRALAQVAPVRAPEPAHALAPPIETLARQLGPSAEARAVIDQVDAVAPTDVTVLILGETGTGKELVAHALHHQSRRRDHAFVTLACGAQPELALDGEAADPRRPGPLQLARGGTVFLDEITSLSLAAQARLLHVLEHRQPAGDRAEVRFVASSNRDLARAVAEGALRADLYYRLARYTITVPALRDRIADLPHLAERFLDEPRRVLPHPVERLDDDATALLARWPWPGNVRELQNTIRGAALHSRGPTLTASDLRRVLEAPTDVRHPDPVTFTQSLRVIAETAAREAEGRAIVEALRVTRGNKAAAARLLQTDYKTLHLKMKLHGIERPASS